MNDAEVANVAAFAVISLVAMVKDAAFVNFAAVPVFNDAAVAVVNIAAVAVVNFVAIALTSVAAVAVI